MTGHSPCTQEAETVAVCGVRINWSVCAWSLTFEKRSGSLVQGDGGVEVIRRSVFSSSAVSDPPDSRLNRDLFSDCGVASFFYHGGFTFSLTCSLSSSNHLGHDVNKVSLDNQFGKFPFCSICVRVLSHHRVTCYGNASGQ
eukprot:TRINITY_DN168979_c0_g1_i1.p1 TRINITY_DN168979_c0_g1~~TRINITY_DN168979_c0_g1_i1.p1  ORF type:complete len:141 (+),score=13.67 TRINITY_DN168979_c0_g1_i1:314-736(+)